MSETEFLFRQPWEDLQAAAWAIRQQHHPPVILFAVPGVKRYETEDYRNTAHRFASISLTGEQCALQCEHCRGELLKGMIPATTPSALLALGRRLVEQGCEGVLISGGADRNGAVPLKPYLEAIARLKEWGLRVVVHTGLPDRETALGLKAAGVDQVLFDFVGDAATLREVLHLDRSPEDYADALALLREAGIPVAPHIVIGLHFGQLRGELAALEAVSRIGADVLVLVVLRPLPRTPMADFPGVDPEAVGRLVAVARLLNPTTPLALGCARPAGPAAVEMEERALLAGVNRIAYPNPATIRQASERRLDFSFVESCCTL
ncbi:MAG: radical SAM protein [Thermoflexales bacterium]|nr:radical SAM protein [Thermoflexales bacterium]